MTVATTTSMTRRLVVGTAGALALAGCSRLGVLNGINDLTPGDGDVERRGRDIAFGSDPRQLLDVYVPRGAANAPALMDSADFLRAELGV